MDYVTRINAPKINPRPGLTSYVRMTNQPRADVRYCTATMSGLRREIGLQILMHIQKVTQLHNSIACARISVLRDNVGPKIFKNLSYICHITVRKLSVAKMCQKNDRKLSEN